MDLQAAVHLGHMPWTLTKEEELTLKQKLHLIYKIPTFSTTNFQLFLDFVKKDAISHTVVI
jgi:hypothetical protein